MLQFNSLLEKHSEAGLRVVGFGCNQFKLQNQLSNS